jgi:hypothetical protein
VSEVEQATVTHVYLEGDSGPVGTTLSVEAVATAIEDVRTLRGPWVRLPMPDGREALLRERVIVAILPAGDDG